MLRNYINLLKRATDALTSFGHGSHGTIVDYFQAVGLEFAVVLLGLLFLAGIVLVVSLPIWGIWFGFRKIDSQTLYGEWKAAFEKYREFWNEVRDKYLELSKNKDATEKEWIDLREKFEEQGISLEGIERHQWFEKVRPRKLIYGYPYESEDLPGKFACGYNTKDYKKVHKTYCIARTAVVVSILVVYIMLMLPFILMWI